MVMENSLMLNSKEQAESDQAVTFLGEMLPPLWWKLYKSSLDQGFNDRQAMSLVLAYIRSQAVVNS